VVECYRALLVARARRISIPLDGGDAAGMKRVAVVGAPVEARPVAG
jgi:hypothetical protein